MPYQIIRTDVRDVSETIDDGQTRNGRLCRDERKMPETRRQTASAESIDAAVHLARALASCGQVRMGRQRIKIIKIG